MIEVLKSVFRHDSADSLNAYMAKLITGWLALFVGLSLGDIATIAALVYTLLNIGFLLYDRIIKPWRSSNRSGFYLGSRRKGK